MIKVCSYAACILDLKLLLDARIIESVSQAIFDYFRGRIELRKISALFHLRETLGKINGNQRECRQQEKILRQVRHSRSARLVDINSHVLAFFSSVSMYSIRLVEFSCIGS